MLREGEVEGAGGRERAKRVGGDRGIDKERDRDATG